MARDKTERLAFVAIIQLTGAQKKNAIGVSIDCRPVLDLRYADRPLILEFINIEIGG